MPDNEYADAPTTTGQHEHDFILQSTSFDTGYDWALLFHCQCGVDKVRHIDVLRADQVPTLKYGPYHMDQLERWLDPEDTTTAGGGEAPRMDLGRLSGTGGDNAVQQPPEAREDDVPGTHVESYVDTGGLHGSPYPTYANADFQRGGRSTPL